MKAFTLSLMLLILGVTAASGQVAKAVAADAARSPKTEPVAEAGSPMNGSVNGSTAATDDVEQPRIATRPPTPLVRK